MNYHTKEDEKILFGGSVNYTSMKWPIGASTTMQHLIGMPGMKSHHYTTILFLVATKGRLYATLDRESDRISLNQGFPSVCEFSAFRHFFKTNVAQNVAELVLYSQKTRNEVIFYQIW